MRTYRRRSTTHHAGPARRAVRAYEASARVQAWRRRLQAEPHDERVVRLRSEDRELTGTTWVAGGSQRDTECFASRSAGCSCSCRSSSASRCSSSSGFARFPGHQPKRSRRTGRRAIDRRDPCSARARRSVLRPVLALRADPRRGRSRDEHRVAPADHRGDQGAFSGNDRVRARGRILRTSSSAFRSASSPRNATGACSTTRASSYR